MHDDIARYIDREAEWRREKAEQYPEDHRNPRAAMRLEELAAYVRALDEHDLRCSELRELTVREGECLPYSGVTDMIGRFGFDDPKDDADAFLTRLVVVARKEADRYASEAA